MKERKKSSQEPTSRKDLDKLRTNVPNLSLQIWTGSQLLELLLGRLSPKGGELGGLGRALAKLTRQLLFVGELADRSSGCGTGTLDCKKVVRLWTGPLLWEGDDTGREGSPRTSCCAPSGWKERVVHRLKGRKATFQSVSVARMGLTKVRQASIPGPL